MKLVFASWASSSSCWNNIIQNGRRIVEVVYCPHEYRDHSYGKLSLSLSSLDYFSTFLATT